MVLTERPWIAAAACLRVEAEEAEWFFSSLEEEQVKAKRICKRCPVRVSCLAFALANGETEGIWGGRDQRQLEQIRSEARRELRLRDG